MVYSLYVLEMEGYKNQGSIFLQDWLHGDLVFFTSSRDKSTAIECLIVEGDLERISSGSMAEGYVDKINVTYEGMPTVVSQTLGLHVISVYPKIMLNGPWKSLIRWSVLRPMT